MAEMSANFKVKNVEALWPKINTTYRFDNAENRSVTCSAFDDGAEYSMQFKMTESQAKELYKEMAKSFMTKKAKGWPEKLKMPFAKDEDGMYIGKARLKGAYGQDATRKPSQYDAKGNKLDVDFLLTTGSKVNVLVSFYPWFMRGEAGVSLRLRAVQVLKYIPMEEPSPFEEEDGFDSSADLDNAFQEEQKVEEPKKLVKKSDPVKPPNQQTDDELSDIVDNWDD
jgi:hypothetical protein